MGRKVSQFGRHRFCADIQSSWILGLGPFCRSCRSPGALPSDWEGSLADDQIKGEYLRAKSPFMASSSFEPGGDDSSPKRQESDREEA
jgi:hypothetical protein